MEASKADGHRRWLIFIPVWIVALAAGVLMPLAIVAHGTEIEIKVEASNTAGDELEVKVEGLSFGALTGTAQLEDAFGNETSLNINNSVGSAGIITLIDTGPGGGRVTIDLNATVPTVSVTGAASAIFIFGTDELELEIELD